MYFDRFDICAAYNLFSCFYGWDAYTHGIQCRLSRMRYRSPSEETLDGLTENAKEIYAALVRKHAAVNVAYDRMIKRAKGRLSDLEIRRAVGLPAPRYPR